MKRTKTLLEYYETYFPTVWTVGGIVAVVLVIIGLVMDDKGLWGLRMIPIGLALFIILCLSISIPYYTKKMKILREEAKKNDK